MARQREARGSADGAGEGEAGEGGGCEEEAVGVVGGSVWGRGDLISALRQRWLCRLFIFVFSMER